jgi:predicted NBD/HSP70 family sugar kinase
VRKLLDEGVVRETGDTVATGGKPRTLLAINSHAAYGAGIHIAQDRMICVVADARGGLVGREVVAGVGGDPPERVVARMADLYRSVTAGLGLAGGSVAGVTVVGAGPVDVAGGMLPAAGLEPAGELSAHSLAADLGLPVLVSNDAAAAAVGEFWGRQVSREETFGCLYMGRGIASGVVLNGSLVRGASSNAGEIGHVTVVRGGRPCPCGNRGCLERYAAPPALVERALADKALVKRLGIDGSEPVEQAFDALARASVLGDRRAEALVDESAALLADAAHTLANIWDLDTLVLAGPGFAVSGSRYVREIRARLAASAFARRYHPVQVDISSNPRDSAAIGGAALMLQSSVAPGHGPAIPPP